MVSASDGGESNADPPWEPRGLDTLRPLWHRVPSQPAHAPRGRPVGPCAGLSVSGALTPCCPSRCWTRPCRQLPHCTCTASPLGDQVHVFSRGRVNPSSTRSPQVAWKEAVDCDVRFPRGPAACLLQRRRRGGQRGPTPRWDSLLRLRACELASALRTTYVALPPGPASQPPSPLQSLFHVNGLLAPPRGVLGTGGLRTRGPAL